MRMEKTVSVNQRIKALLPWVLVFLWMFLIFHMSAQPATESNSLSMGVTEKVIETVNKVKPGEDLNLENVNHVVRKNAHFFAYLMLAVLTVHALRRGGKLDRLMMLLAQGICVLYAASDETHQIFVPGRGPQVKDVFIDSSGALLGIGIYYVINQFFCGRRTKDK
ncbi:VanZ family protein [Paenibacillus sp. BSR1-1]|uniref:VanZ family protein n=1 Tax=Paenibacillus sp. BSR1-1 TaxID=3020845 RepID=UPI0025B1619C|nr:VanZ family protein [Paenibacillus sp. BSR1-1]MDN3019579.1 VanZ family protein [Paenibacillus sp. BSR1-1]